MDRSTLEHHLAQSQSLAQIARRFGLHEATVGYWIKKHGLIAAGREKYAPKGGLSRKDLEPLVEQGASLTQIADTVGRSTATVRH